MKTLYLISFVLLMIVSPVHGYYYYSDSRAIQLEVDSSEVLILFADGYSFNSEEIIEAYPRIDSISDYSIYENFRVANISTGEALEEFIDTLNCDYRIAFANPYFIFRDSLPKLVGRSLCCKFAEWVSYDFIDNLNAAHGVEIINEKPYSPKQFLLNVSEESIETPLEIANLYYELDETEFCHPNFLGGYEWTGSYYIYDHYWEEQWAMHRIFQATPDSIRHKAFEITAGDTNIIVAVLDQGTLPHEDLPEHRYVAGYDYAAMDDDPSACDWYYQGYHGIGVAGIIGASHNRYPELVTDENTGIYGISPLCKIMPIRIGTGFQFWPYINDSMITDWGYPDCAGLPFVTSDRLESAISWAYTHNADIISCSWGSTEPDDNIRHVIQLASTLGRDGKGCGIFFASGNTPTDTVYYPAMYPEVISVGALHPDDSVWGYSGRAKVDVVAPSGRSTDHPIWTLDLMDSLGYNTPWRDLGCGDPNDIDYNCRFGGTSAAQPVAAGVAALVLARDSGLTHDELHDVIRLSADPNLYETITNPPHEKYGYGMVHPLRALLAVCRGDADNSGAINILDIDRIIEWLYENGPEPRPHVLMADADSTGTVNILDASYIVRYLYKGGPPPPISFNYGDYW
jgi:subtilisin family serine protease